MSRAEWEWLPRLSIPGEKPDLCYQMNRALAEAKGEVIIFLQDHIEINPGALQRIWELYQSNPNVAVTFPVGKRNGESVSWDWRAFWEDHLDKSEITYERFEIDFAMIPRTLLAKVLDHDGYFFDEGFDSGFGYDNVEIAYRMSKLGVKFFVSSAIRGVAFDHDRFEPHPYKPRGNQDLWIVKQGLIDLNYGGDGIDQTLDTP